MRDTNLKLFIESLSLRSYQKLAVESIVKDYLCNHSKILINMATGTGKTSVIVSVIYTLLKTKTAGKILYLSNRKVLDDQIKDLYISMFTDSGKDLIENIEFVSEALENKRNYKYDVIIADEYHGKDNSNVDSLLNTATCIIGFYNPMILNENNIESAWFRNATVSFSYSLHQMVAEGYLSANRDQSTVDGIIKLLFSEIGFSFVDIAPEIHLKDNILRPDYLAINDDEYIIIEVKSFFGRNVSSEVVRASLNQIERTKSILQSISSKSFYKYCLILLCEVDELLKDNFYKRTGISVWDVSNLLYIAKNSPSLINQIISYLPFPAIDIMTLQPNGQYINCNNFSFKESFASESTAREYINRLNGCSPGKENKADIEYSNLCYDILQFLFSNEFYMSSKQHRTNDNIFQMDIICALKGSAEYWRFLMEHYNSKFVVFDAKNYSEPLKQNVIYTTSKYLFQPALRNVLVIISRR